MHILPKAKDLYSDLYELVHAAGPVDTRVRLPEEGPERPVHVAATREAFDAELDAALEAYVTRRMLYRMDDWADELCARSDNVESETAKVTFAWVLDLLRATRNELEATCATSIKEARTLEALRTSGNTATHA